MIKKIDHYVVTTNNIEKCIEFYKLLGFKFIKENENPALVGNGFKIKIHGIVTNATPLPDNVQVGCIDICFEVDEPLNKVIKYLNDNNIKIKMGPVDRVGYNGNMKSIYINDPDGNLIELSKYN